MPSVLDSALLPILDMPPNWHSEAGVSGTIISNGAVDVFASGSLELPVHSSGRPESDCSFNPDSPIWHFCLIPPEAGHYYGEERFKANYRKKREKKRDGC